jgi:glycosyltransferase involved in cell wall biosynthesis
VSIIRISIIIPVYNTSKYLKQCIESVLSQEYKDYEIILVDDGSTDSSGDICDFYSSAYGFIMTIHKENGGLSDARNIGLKHAKGDFVLFIDSDDYISQGSLLSVQNTIEENSDVDVVFLEAIKVFPNGRTVPLRDGYRKEAIYNKSQDSVLEHLAELPKFPGSACTKLIKRSLIKNNNLFFEKNQLSEDIDWTIRLLITQLSDQKNWL